MLQFANPLFLFSLLGLAIPIAVHLWSRKAGKRIRIGSIALLQQAPSKQMRSIRLHELALLLLRCLLLSLLALLISRPQWMHTQPNKQPGWVLISPGISSQINQDKSLSQAIDTLQQNGYEVRWFDHGFAKIKNNPLPETLAKITSKSYWSLLKEAEEKLPAGTGLYIITDERLQHFGGKRPATDLNVQWITLPTPDTTAAWLADAFVDQTDSLHIRLGISKPEGNVYQTIVYKIPPAPVTISNTGLPPLKITFERGTFTLTFSGTNQSIQADTSTLNVSIMRQEAEAEDARYVSSAMKAIAGFTRRKINIIQVNTPEQIPANTNWLFWLSSQEIPARWKENVTKGINLLHYASTEKFTSVQTWLTLLQNSDNQIYLNRISEARADGNTLWESGYGTPVLTQQTLGKGSIFHLYTRFNPQWNGLVWDASFAEALLQLLHETSWKYQGQAEKKYDVRVIGAQQLQPLTMPAVQKLEENRQVTNLHIPLWILAVLIFVFERWISEQKWESKGSQRKNPAQQVVS